MAFIGVGKGFCTRLFTKITETQNKLSLRIKNNLKLRIIKNIYSNPINSFLGKTY